MIVSEENVNTNKESIGASNYRLLKQNVLMYKKSIEDKKGKKER